MPYGLWLRVATSYIYAEASKPRSLSMQVLDGVAGQILAMKGDTLLGLDANYTNPADVAWPLTFADIAASVLLPLKYPSYTAEVKEPKAASAALLTEHNDMAPRAQMSIPTHHDVTHQSKISVRGLCLFYHYSLACSLHVALIPRLPGAACALQDLKHCIVLPCIRKLVCQAGKPRPRADALRGAGLDHGRRGRHGRGPALFPEAVQPGPRPDAQLDVRGDAGPAAH